MNPDANVTKRVKTPQDLRYCPLVLSANGRIRPDWVLVNGREERHPEGVRASILSLLPRRRMAQITTR